MLNLLQDTVAFQADKRPAAIAVVSGREMISYGELDQTANRLARLLQASGCHPGDRVCILLPKSISAIVGMLASLKAGCIYVPMDLASPPIRLGKIMEVCECKCILAAPISFALLNSLRSLWPGRPMQVGWMDVDPPPGEATFSWGDLGTVSAAPITCRTPAEHPAHILFTSGSTGVPKGVVITHANVAHFLRWADKYFGAGPSDRISCHSPLHFDLSTFDIYGAFHAGARLYLVTPEIALLPHRLAQFIRDSALTQWLSVPSVLKYMVRHNVIQFQDFPSLKRLLWCGESMPTPTLRRLMQRLPHVTFTNLYGPTEATIASSYYTVLRCPEEQETEIPIGHACEGEQLLVLDNDQKPVSNGMVGDLYIRGVGLSPGYWRDDDRTREVFFPAPDCAQGGDRIYKTGDLAKVAEDGLIYLVGRADLQIKSRGYRIELEEIEAALYSLGLLQECAVVALRTEGVEGNVICCAYVSSSEDCVSSLVLRSRVSKILPYYMLPSRWMRLQRLPLNGNGKIDRSALKMLFENQTMPSRRLQ